MNPDRLSPALLILLFFTGCATAEVQTPGEDSVAPAFEDSHIRAPDGVRLPFTRWEAQEDPRRVVLALHGFNDFRLSHQPLAEWLSRSGSTVYAYDQRGFGATEQRGIWPGEEALVADATTVLELLHERYPDTPVYLLGESMGAGVTLLTLSQEDAPAVAGAILMAPAVWGRDAQPWYQRAGLWLGTRTLPRLEVDTRWANVDPSDDPEVLHYWEHHPLVIRETRVDALEGVTDLMGSALRASPGLQVPTLIVYGGRDEVVPPEAICRMLKTLPDADSTPWRYAHYPEGWHLLARDSRSPETLADLVAWLEHPQADLPSGREHRGEAARETVCD